MLEIQVDIAKPTSATPARTAPLLDRPRPQLWAGPGSAEAFGSGEKTIQTNMATPAA
jgi:hypothetical protein